MSDNEISQSSQKDDLVQNNSEENNEFVKTLNEMSENDPPSTINQISQTSTINNTIFNIMKSELKSNSFPYLNKEKIPEIIIKDENYFEYGGKIEDYLKTPININFIDNIYNLCEICKINNNELYCESCNINYCKKCSKKHHTGPGIINFHELKDETEYYRNDIIRIIKEYLIEPEKRKQMVKTSKKVIK